MKLLELFSGTGSVGEPFRAQGHEVISVDVDPRFLQPGDIQEDILQLDYKSLPWVPDVLWGSPPCTEYSRAKTRGHRNLELADRLVAKWIEISHGGGELGPKVGLPAHLSKICLGP